MTRRIAAIGSSLGISPRITGTGAVLDTFPRHPSKSHLQFVGSFNSLMCDLHAMISLVINEAKAAAHIVTRQTAK